MRHFHTFLARGLDEPFIPHAQLPFWHVDEANDAAKLLAASLFFPTKTPKVRMYEPAIHEQDHTNEVARANARVAGGHHLYHYIIGNKVVYVEECIAEACSPDGDDDATG